MEEKKGNTNATSSTGIRASKPPRPTLTLAPRNPTEAFLKGVDAATPSPMTFVASLFSDHDPYEGGDSKSFSQLLAGAIASSPSALSDSNKNPSAASASASTSASASASAPSPAPQEEKAPNTNSAKFKSKMPPKIPIPRSPYITIPPGLSPTMLLQSPVLLPSAQVRCLHLFSVYIYQFLVSGVVGFNLSCSAMVMYMFVFGVVKISHCYSAMSMAGLLVLICDSYSGDLFRHE